MRRIQWEYVCASPDQLEGLGRNGWELVSVVEQRGEHVCYLKRPRLTLVERVTLDQRQDYMEECDTDER